MPPFNSPQSVLTLSTISQKKKEAKKKITTITKLIRYNSDLNLKVPLWNNATKKASAQYHPYSAA